MSNRLQAVLLGVILGILLIIIGIGTESDWVFLIGTLIMPIVLFWGGLFLQGENLAMRIAMVAVAGAVVAATILSCGGSTIFSSSLW
ncbi:MAG TPA: hypothetical protein G4O18_04365 [Dehalococcoidia bacterium]|nr:hypothetical protein [Dehalococcoidia bacterium]